MINWKVRFKNKYFWLALIPAVIMLVSQVLQIFGICFDTDGIGEAIESIVGTVFTILALLGIVNDPTTATLADSVNAMTYDAPKVSSLTSEAEKGDDDEDNSTIGFTD